MPQDSIIRADGTGDYTSDIAWEAAEQDADYGAVTNAFLDGAITRSNRLTFSGAWPNGGRIQAFNNAFDGNLNNTPPSITSTAGTGFIRNTSASTLELSGISMIHGGTSGALDCRVNSSARIVLTDSYIDAGTNKNIIVLAAGSSFEATNSVLRNAGMVFNAGSSFANVTLSSCSLFGDRDSILLNRGSASDCVVVNSNTGNCFSNVTQSNNASSDATADTLTNIVIADEFVDSNPVSSGDYRIASGSDLDTNGIGAFIQGGTAPIVVDESLSNTGSISLDPVISLSAPVILNEAVSNTDSVSNTPVITFNAPVIIQESISNSDSVSLNPSVSLVAQITVNESVSNSNSSALNPEIFLAANVVVNELTSNTESGSLNPTILLSVPITVNESISNSVSESLNPTIEFVGAVNVIEEISNTDSVSQAPTITLSASVVVDESLSNTDSQSNNPTINLGAEIIINESVSNTGSISVNPVIDLVGAVSVNESTSNTASNSNNPAITIGQAVRIENITISYKQNDIILSYKPNDITISYGSN